MRIRTSPPKIVLAPGRSAAAARSWKRTHVATGEGVPPSLADISHAVAVGPFCHTGGQLAVDAEGRFRGGSAGEQAVLAFANLLAVLRAAGFVKDDVVFLDIALSAIAELPEVNEVFRSIFEHRPRPARAVAEVAALPLGAKVRLHAFAIKDRLPAAG